MKNLIVDKPDYGQSISPTLVSVSKDDIEKIGHTMFNEDGCLSIICSHLTCNVEGILLRSILLCYGPEYKILDTSDFAIVNHLSEDVMEISQCLSNKNPIPNMDIVFRTNLPWNLYKDLGIYNF